MKWQKNSMDALPEKTFLIIDKNLPDVEAKSKQSVRSSDSGTWPPKVRKKKSKTDSARSEVSNSSVEHERPMTANLAAPSVLDPCLVDKLDMSLLSKESLIYSLTRIKLAVKRSEDRKLYSSSSQTSLSSNKTYLSPVSKNKLTPEDVETKSTKDSNVSDYQGESNGTAKTSETKRLDDNNNKSKSPLSPLRNRSSRSDVSLSDVSIFTGGHRKVAPEPCRSCGRDRQPERFHSHPYTIKGKEAVTDNSKSPSQQSIPVPITSRRGSPSSSGNFDQKKSKLPKSSTETLVEISPSSDVQRMNEKRPSSGTEKSASKRGPKTVTCYICGRDFGTASFPIHEPQCMQKWKRENALLPSSQRRKSEPQRPELSILSPEWNTAAWEQSQTLLVPCSNCGRTFHPDRLNIHEKSCRPVPKETSRYFDSSDGSDSNGKNHQYEITTWGSTRGKSQQDTPSFKQNNNVTDKEKTYGFRKYSPNSCTSAGNYSRRST